MRFAVHQLLPQRVAGNQQHPPDSPEQYDVTAVDRIVAVAHVTDEVLGVDAVAEELLVAGVAVLQGVLQEMAVLERGEIQK